MARRDDRPDGDAAGGTDGAGEVSAGSLGMSSLLLRFAPATQTRFEAATGEDRVRHLRRSIAVGLVFYNAYNLSDPLLAPDVAALAIAARLLLITPVALLLIAAVPRLRPLWREGLVLLAMVGVVAVPAAVLGLSRSPLAGYTFAEVPLVLVFGGMMLVLNVAGMMAFTAATAAVTLAAILYQPAYAGLLRPAMVLQLASACAFVLYGNRQIEIVRRRGFLETLRAMLRSETLERAKSRLAAISATDALTGLANRRAFNEALAACEPLRADVALVMIDLDYFKCFNDRYGHPAGDACLQAVAAVIAAAASPDDHVARYGGEEFVMLIEGQRVDQLAATVDRLRQGVRRLPIEHAARPDGKNGLSVSVGVAMGAATAADLLAQADAALYQAKHDGRDRAEIAVRPSRLVA